MVASPVSGRSPAATYPAHFASALAGFDQRPKLVVDYDQIVVWCCDDAHRILIDPIPLQLHDGRLCVNDEDLRAEFAAFLHGAGSNVERKLVRGKANRHWAVVQAWKPDGWDGEVCIICTPSLPLRSVVESGLARELKLTNAEARVLKEFSELNSPKQIARELGVSLSTVRSHLKTIHAKASVSSSTQLLRLAHSFCSV